MMLPRCVPGPLADDGLAVVLGLLPWPSDVAAPERPAGEAGRARAVLQAGVSGEPAHLRAVLLSTPQQGKGPAEVSVPATGEVEAGLPRCCRLP